MGDGIAILYQLINSVGKFCEFADKYLSELWCKFAKKIEFSVGAGMVEGIIRHS